MRGCIKYRQSLDEQAADALATTKSSKAEFDEGMASDRLASANAWLSSRPCQIREPTTRRSY
jgi:hypothetical protein